MKRPHPRKIATIALYSVIGLVVAVWMGLYVSWRIDSVTYNLGKLGIYRQVSPPKSVGENYLKLFVPLAAVDGWINGETVYVDRRVLVSLPWAVRYPVFPDIEDFSDLGFGDEAIQRRKTDKIGTMKRRLVYLSMAIGVIPWLWVGSYAGFRELNSKGFSLSGVRFVHLPSWAESMESSYAPLAKVDQELTGTRVVFVRTVSCWQYPP